MSAPTTFNGWVGEAKGKDLYLDTNILLLLTQ